MARNILSYFQVDFDKVQKVESGWDNDEANNTNESDDFW